MVTNKEVLKEADIWDRREAPVVKTLQDFALADGMRAAHKCGLMCNQGRLGPD